MAFRPLHDRVVVKHTGGTVGIFFRHIEEPDRTATLAAKDAAAAPQTTVAAANCCSSVAT